MRSVVESGSGTRARLPDRPAAGKTGTTQAARDAWFIGFTDRYVAGVWMGYDDNRPLAGVSGSGLPAEIWRETMLRIHRGVPATPLPVYEAPPEQPAEVPALVAGGAPAVEEGPSLGGILSDVIAAIRRSAETPARP
jgi:membrane peptidoglycan carboxypeptidase